VYRSKMYGGTFLAATRARCFRITGASMCRGSQGHANWTAKVFVATSSNKLYYDALYQSATPFVFVSPGAQRVDCAVGPIWSGAKSCR